MATTAADLSAEFYDELVVHAVPIDRGSRPTSTTQGRGRAPAFPGLTQWLGSSVTQT